MVQKGDCLYSGLRNRAVFNCAEQILTWEEGVVYYERVAVCNLKFRLSLRG